MYQAAEPFSSNLACVKVNNQYGFINPAGQFVISATYDYAESFNGNLAKCSKNGFYGLLTTSGTEYLEFEYVELRLSKNKKYYVGKKSQDENIYVITIEADSPEVKGFDDISDSFQYGLADVQRAGLYGYIDGEGRVVMEPSYLELPSYSDDNLAVTHKESGYGLIDSNLKTIIPEQYTYIEKSANGNYHYGNSPNSFGIVSSSGKILTEEGTYHDITAIDDSLYTALDNHNKYCVIDENGFPLLSGCDKITVTGYVAEYTKGKESGKLNLLNGKMAVLVKGKEIWSSGKAIKIRYEAPFVLWVDDSGKEHRITESGDMVFEGYSQIKLISKGYYALEKNNKMALANASGQILTEWVDEVLPLMEDYLKLVKNVKSIYNVPVRSIYAIYRISTGKMITGYDYSFMGTPETIDDISNVITVDFVNGDRFKWLKLNGDDYYTIDVGTAGLYKITDSRTKKMGFMKSGGKILAQPKYDEIGQFRNGMCRVWILEKGYGFVNASGTLVVPCKYPHVLDFGSIDGVKNYTQVWDNWGQSYYIDKNGKIADPDKVLREVYDSQRQNSWY